MTARTLAKKGTWTSIFALAFVLLSLLALDRARAAPLLAPALSANPSSGPAGSITKLVGSGFTYATGALPLQVRWDGVTKATLVLPKSGSFSELFTIPAGAAPGTHEISVCNFCGPEFEESATTKFIVTGAPTDTSLPPAPTSTPLPPKPTDTPTPVPPKPSNTPTASHTAPPATTSPSGLADVCEDLGLGLDSVVVDFEQNSGTFYDDIARDFGVLIERSAEKVLPRVAPHSPTSALRGAIAQEFGSPPIHFNFERPVAAVGMFVGLDPAGTVDGDVTAVLTVYGFRDGVQPLVELGSDAVTLPPGPSDIRYCLRVVPEAGDPIIRAVLEYYDNTGNTHVEPRLMDDLTLLYSDVALPEDRPPLVEITSPSDGVLVPGDAVTVGLRATITEDRWLRRVWYRINDSEREQIGFSTGSLTEYLTGLSFSPVRFEFRRTNTLTIEAEDSSGQMGSDTITVHYDPLPTPTPTPALDIIAYKFEITQAIQCLENPSCGADNSIPIYRGKPTLVRLYVRASGTASEIANITGRLCVRWWGYYADRYSSCVAPLAPVTVAVVANPVQAFRGDLSRTLNFLIPSHAVNASANSVTELDIDMSVNVPHPNPELNYGMYVPECCRANNSFSTRLVLDSGRPLDIEMIRGEGADGIYPDADDWLAPARFLNMVYPTGRINYWAPEGDDVFDMVDDYADTPSDDCGDGWDHALDDLDEYDFFRDDPVDYYRDYAMIDERVRHGYHGCGETPGDSAAGMVNTAAHWADFAGQIMAQEVAHNHGRDHAPGCGAGDPDGGYPSGTDAAGSTGMPIIGEWGIDLRSMTLYPPDDAYDFMSYCGGAGTVTDFGSYRVNRGGIWVGPYTYRALAGAIRSIDRIPDPRAGALMKPPPAVQPGIEVLAGRVEVGPQSASLRWGFYRLPLPADEALPRGDAGRYTVELLDAAGASLLQRLFDPLSTGEDHDPERGVIRVILPWQPGAAQIIVRRDQRTLLTVPVSPNPPALRLLSPNGGESWQADGVQRIEWESSDLDGDALTYVVQYSSDGGLHWSPLALHRSETSLEIDASNLAGAAQARLRIIASDGVNTTMDEADAEFSVAQKPPKSAILSPYEGQSFPVGEQALFMGAALDLEDRLVEDTAYYWTSDRDGLLGVGRNLWGLPLSPGRHQITLTVTDRDGLATRAQVSIVVGGAEAAGDPSADRPPLWLFGGLGLSACAGLLLVLIPAGLWLTRRRARVGS